VIIVTKQMTNEKHGVVTLNRTAAKKSLVWGLYICTKGLDILKFEQTPLLTVL